MTLYEIDAQLRALLELEDGNYVDQSTGELLTQEAVDELNMDFNNKVESCLLFALEKQREADAIDEEMRRLGAKKEAAVHKYEWILGYVSSHIEPGKKFNTPKVGIKWTTSKKAEPLDNFKELTPAEYWKLPEPQLPVVDKATIRKELLAGKTIPGWTLTVSKNLKIA